MTTPARPGPAARSRSSDRRPISVPAPTLASEDHEDHEVLVIDLPGVENDDHRHRGTALDRLQGDGERTDDQAMAETESAPARQEVGVSFPMTTSAQVELRDAIRARTQERLDALRARSSA